MKLFVGRLPDQSQQEDLRTYFSEFGDLADVYVPAPFRGFGFVTFTSSAVARHVLNLSHMIKVTHYYYYYMIKVTTTTEHCSLTNHLYTKMKVFTVFTFVSPFIPIYPHTNSLTQCYETFYASLFVSVHIFLDLS